MTDYADFKAQLIERFKDDQAMGIREVDSSTGLTEEEHGDSDDYDGVSVLPSGDAMGVCTNCARYAVTVMGEGQVYGFFTDDNPSVTDEEILGCGGHDFAVFRNRYIVDIWVRHFAGVSDQHVFDLHDPNDHAKIRALYGDPECWVNHSPEAVEPKPLLVNPGEGLQKNSKHKRSVETEHSI